MNGFATRFVYRGLRSMTTTDRRQQQSSCTTLYHRYYSNNQNEAALQETVIQNPPYPFSVLYKQEYHVVPGQSHRGVGDLIFADPTKTNNFLIVETKYLNGNSHSKKRNKAEKQARFYGNCLQSDKPNASVKMATYTNLDGLKFL